MMMSSDEIVRFKEWHQSFGDRLPTQADVSQWITDDRARQVQALEANRMQWALQNGSATPAPALRWGYNGQLSTAPSTAAVSPDELYEAWPMSAAKVGVGMLAGKIDPMEVLKELRASATRPPQGAGMTEEEVGEKGIEAALNFSPGNLPYMGGLMLGKNALKAPLGKSIKGYHATTREFDNFDLSAPRRTKTEDLTGEGVFFYGDKSDAERLWIDPKKEKGARRIIESDVTMKNPYVFKKYEDLYDYTGVSFRDPDKARKLTEALKAKGHDGWVKQYQTKEGIDEFVTFNPKNIYQRGVGSRSQAVNTSQGRAEAPTKSGLSLAEDLAAKGADADEIWGKTGWRADPKGNWAFEIDDSMMNFKVKEIPKGKDVFLEDIIEYPDLFQNYPQLKQIKVNRSTTLNGYVDGNIYLKDFDKERVIHEVQHAVQEIEGWPKGSSSTKATPELMEATKAKTPFEWYHRQFGEFQARDSASRATWGTEERNLVRPYSSEMEPKEGWIYRGGEGGMSSSIPTKLSEITEQDVVSLIGQLQNARKEFRRKWPVLYEGYSKSPEYQNFVEARSKVIKTFGLKDTNYDKTRTVKFMDAQQLAERLTPEKAILLWKKANQ